MDANYKTAKRVVVYKKDVGYYRPYVGYVTVLGIFNQVLTWRFLHNSESHSKKDMTEQE